MAARRTRKDDGSQWTVGDSRSVYGIRHWGAGYFSINDAGRVEVPVSYTHLTLPTTPYV